MYSEFETKTDAELIEEVRLWLSLVPANYLPKDLTRISIICDRLEEKQKQINFFIIELVTANEKLEKSTARSI